MWWTYLGVVLALRGTSLPEAVARIDRGMARRRPVAAHPTARLNAAVDRCLRVGRVEARCLTAALVLYRLLRRQGDVPALVIGVLPDGSDHRAHAWVELDSRVVGPPPGRNGHVELARFGG